MNESSGIADLHMHTTASDGTVGVRQRARLAAEEGVETIAVTDHDSIAESLTARTQRMNGVELVTGVEVRADLFDTKIEILGYFLDPSDASLRAMLRQAREYRRDRNRELVETLAVETSLDLSYESLSDSVDGILGRPHLAEVLIEAGVVDSVAEAFQTYLAEGG